MISECPFRNPDDLVFRGESGDAPLHARAFIDSLYSALEAIGIDETQRKTRNLTLHL